VVCKEKQEDGGKIYFLNKNFFLGLQSGKNYFFEQNFFGHLPPDCIQEHLNPFPKNPKIIFLAEIIFWYHLHRPSEKL